MIHSGNFVEVTIKESPQLPDSRGNAIKNMLLIDHQISIDKVRVSLKYDIKGILSKSQLNRSVYDLFADPIIELALANSLLLDSKEVFPQSPDLVIQVGFKPGVTDNTAQAALDGLTTLFPSLDKINISCSKTYMFWGLQTDIAVSYTHLTLPTKRIV